jgi:hypothetical protein
MAVTHSLTARNAATNAVTGLIGNGGVLAFRISPSTVAAPGTVAATLLLSTPAFGTATTGTATANGIISDNNATGNASPVAFASIQTAGGTVIIHCEVAASGSDINMSNGLTIAAGDTVSCTSLTYTALTA